MPTYTKELNEPKFRKSLGAILAIIILLFVALILNSLKNKEESQELPELVSGEMTLQGETVCLPHKDTSGPITLECAIGLRTSDGSHFALDMQEYREENNGFFLDTGKSVEIYGIVVPVEALSSIQKYDIRGVMRVQTIREIENDTTKNEENNAAHTTRGGILSFSVPSSFGLAVNQNQILVDSYIPPCDSDFDYCIYYNGNTYQNTNFDSAGLRIKEKTDLTTQSACLNTLPEGYSSLTPRVEEQDTYATSLFEPLGDAGAGHYSQGALYRLFTQNTCYEFETRIGESQFANYPEGSIEQFRETDRAQIEQRLRNILDSIRIRASNIQVIFPSRS